VSDGQRLETLEDWAGPQNLGLTLVFTDIVDSTRIGIRLGDTRWIEALFEHFSELSTSVFELAFTPARSKSEKMTFMA
jgi:class 3 adenylate cyclase